jgi:hypothetical protein
MRLKSLEKIIKQTRVKILVDNEVYFHDAVNEIIFQRKKLENYIKNNPEFQNALIPLFPKKDAPEIVKRMCQAAKIFDVGPMAAVAGIIAEYSCKKMIQAGAKSAIVENGGDLYAGTNDKLIIGLFSDTQFDNLAFVLTNENTPLAICSSSSLLGHSLSFGKCDLAVVFSTFADTADCAATKLANLINEEEDIKPSLEYILSKQKVLGAIAIKNKTIGMAGKLPEIIAHEDTKLKNKITKDPIYYL